MLSPQLTYSTVWHDGPISTIILFKSVVIFFFWGGGGFSTLNIRLFTLYIEELS